MHHPTDRIAYTTSFVTPVVEHWLERGQIYDTNIWQGPRNLYSTYTAATSRATLFD